MFGYVYVGPLVALALCLAMLCKALCVTLAVFGYVM